MKDNNLDASSQLFIKNVIENALVYANDLPRFLRQISQQLNALIGGKTIVLTQTSKDPELPEKVLHVLSHRRHDEVEKRPFSHILTLCKKEKNMVEFRCDDGSEIGLLLSQMGYKNLVLMPLNIQQQSIGLCLFFDAELQFNSPDIATIQRLSPFISTILHNALQMNSMEQLVTQRTRRLLETEQRFNAVVTSTQEGIIVIQDGRVIFSNPSAEALLGYSPAEFLSLKFSDIIDPLEWEKVWDNYVARMRGDDIPHSYETRIVDKQGYVVSAEINASVMQYNGALAYLVFLRDITDRITAEQAFKESERHLLRAMELADLGSFVYYVKSKHFVCSDTFYRLLGYEPHSIKFTTDILKASLHPEEMSQLKESVDKMDVGDTVIRQIPYKRGTETRHCRVIAEKLHEEQTDITWLNCIIQDITQHAQDAAKLEEYNRSLEKMVESRTKTLEESRRALTSLLEDSNKIREDLEKMNDKLLKETTIRKRSEQLVTLQSKTLTALTLGTGQKEILQIVCDEVKQIIPHSGVMILREYNNLLEPCCWAGLTETQLAGISEELDASQTDLFPGKASSVNTQSAILSKDYKAILQRLNYQFCWYEPIISKNEKNLGVFVLTGQKTDIPPSYESAVLNSGAKLIALVLERKLADRQEMVFSHRLQEMNKELEAFAYSVSHDLRAPLRHIDGFTSALKKNIVDTLSETNRHYLNRILESTRRMGRLIDDLLVFSRMGRQPLKKCTIDLGVLVDSVIRELDPDISGRDIRWTIEPLGTVFADQNLLKQVMINLISNALKFTKTRQQACIHIGVRENNLGQKVYFVKDNGVGFNMAYKHKLFGVFQRLHRDDQFEGTGIGLANVKRIIKRHGGDVMAYGELNNGAKFSFTLDTEQF